MLKRTLIFALAGLSLCGLGCDAPSADKPSTEAPKKVSLTVGRVPSADGIPIAYTSRGSGDVALVFVHGWLCDQTYWKHQVAAFTDRFQVVTVDLPGHGDSMMTATRSEWTLEAYGADVAGLVEGLGLEKVVLVGHSMGGAVILEAAPKLGDRVLGLVGVETFHNAEFEVADDVWDPLIAAYHENFEGTCHSMVSAMFPRPSDELALEVRGDMCEGPAEIGVALLERFGAYVAAPKMAALGDLPIRTINAEFSTPTQVEINRRHAPQFDAAIQDQAGHFLMLEHPEAFNGLFEETLESIGAL
ncbi:MAG: alpha/beta hydrolase [Acidobacteriota bacterium]